MEEKTKKRKRHGRMVDVAKKLRVHSHETGPDCRCKRHKCFSVISYSDKKEILKMFNNFETFDEQNSYLAGLITVVPVQRRRPRLAEAQVPKFNDASYTYRVRCRAPDNENMMDIQVCYKALISLHGITPRRIQTIQTSLKHDGSAPRDGRGSHESRPHKLTKATITKVCEHISSFKGRSSHYSLAKSNKTYLSEELSVSKMYDLFKIKHPETKISYNRYREIFNEKFNISFGYPRSDTCSKCDEITVKVKNLESKLSKANDNDKKVILSDLKKLETDKKVHIARATAFYDRKKTSKRSSRQQADLEAICMDYSKNLPIPNISTNDVYYSRQLSLYLFNLHVLSNQQSVFYVYSEIIGKKGSDNVCSLLHHYMYNYLPANIKRLQIFCDSCGGQNKNYTVFRFLHHVIHYERRLDEIQITFPIRGHSYMECDKDFGLVNQKSKTEIPSDWIDVLRSSRVKPAPFDVEDTNQDYFRSWGTHLGPLYKKKCPFRSRPIREIKLSVDHPRLVYYRVSYNGAWESADIVGKHFTSNQSGEFKLPEKLYEGTLFL